MTPWPWVVSCLSGPDVWWHGCPARPGPGLHDGCPTTGRFGAPVSVVVDDGGVERAAVVAESSLAPFGRLEAGPVLGGRGWGLRIGPHPWRLPHVETPGRRRRRVGRSKWAPLADLPADATLLEIVEAAELIAAGERPGQLDLFGVAT